MFILILLAVSVLAGMFLRGIGPVRHLEKTATWTVWLLILVFGISLGSNEDIVNNFGRFGLTALVVALAGVAGSVLGAWALKSYIDKGKQK